ncbi:hypothetical protein JCM10212_003550 [Sporobolomyces blumeae]
MSASDLADSIPHNISLTGGVPLKSQDLAASIIYVIAFVLVVPLALFRICRCDSRTAVLVRPSIFVGLRIGAYIVRSIQADGNYGSGLFIAEQILFLCGFLLLVEPFTTLVKYNFYRNWIPTGEKNGLARILLLMRLAIFAAIDLGIYVGSRTSAAMSDPDLASSLKSCRWAGGIITVVVIGLGLVLTLRAQLSGQSDLHRTTYLLALGTCLMVPAAYKLVFYGHPADPLSSTGKAVFYILWSLPELFATILYYSINLSTTFDLREGYAKEKWNKKKKDGKVVGDWGHEVERRMQARGELGMLGSNESKESA